jgi:Gram-negative bacterial TonB protein C-terminal
MADAVRNQGAALEIPVTIQGSKIVEGTEQRELFVETTKTTLVFENGTVLRLNAKVSPGQCVFLRNDQTEREILCKVVESRQAGAVSYTNLEFTSYDPQFWGAEKLEPAGTTAEIQDQLESAVKSQTAAPIMEQIAPIGAEVPAQTEQPTAAAQKLEMQKEIKAAWENPVGAPTMESSAPSSAEIPPSVPESATTSEASATAPDSPLPVVLEAAHESLTVAHKDEPTDEELDWNDAKDAELVAALAAMEGKPRVPKESDAKEAKRSGQEAGSEGTPGQGKKSAKTSGDAAVLSTPTAKPRKFTAGKNPIVVKIAAAVLMAAALGFVWHTAKGFSIHRSNPLPVVSAQSQQQARPVTAQPSQTPTAAVASTGAQKPGVAAAQSPAATASVPGPTAVSKGGEDSATPDAPKVAANKSSASSEQAAPARAARQKPNEINDGGNIPARIVSQEPPAIPAWATGLESNEVVTLDALIDEKGNLVETKPISGPRILLHEAQRAVALWVFEPALSDGKPVATRMVLTVQFQN